MDARFSGADRRRSSRLPLSVPVFVTGQNTIVQSRCDTLDVSHTGARLRSRRMLPHGTVIRLDVLGGNGIATGRVVRVLPSRGSFVIGVKFDAPANIWNVKNPPSDWRPTQLKLRDS
ncbi:MAG TPA: PilZ domain-containing protein [Nitrospirales bacterium]|nr:PilZ domain-containing protein [Nitrospirales bacterium]